MGRFSRRWPPGPSSSLPWWASLPSGARLGWARANLGVAGIVVAVAALVPFFAIWLGVSILLPHGEAPWQALAPGALLVAVGMQVVHLGTVLFVADRVERASATYGSFGAALTVLVWLYVVSRVIVASAMLDAALWERRRGDAGQSNSRRRSSAHR